MGYLWVIYGLSMGTQEDKTALDIAKGEKNTEMVRAWRSKGHTDPSPTPILLHLPIRYPPPTLSARTPTGAYCPYNDPIPTWYDRGTTL